jgi:recombinational DNA repair protein RecT
MNQITEQKRTSYPDVVHVIKSKDTINRLTLALGLSTENDDHKQKAFQYASSVLAEVERNIGTDKDVSKCRPQSIVQAMIDSARLKLFIDARQHCHLIKFGENATIQIGYRGYINKIKDHFKDCHIHYDTIMEGDIFKMSTSDSHDTYSHVKADPLNDKYDQVKGVYVAISYVIGDRSIQKVTVLSRSMIDRIKGTAKTAYIWRDWYIEKAIAACIKRACKIHFAGITEIQEVIQYDNENNHVAYNDKPPEVKTENPFETMNRIKEGVEVIEPKSNDIENTAADQIIGLLSHAIDGITDFESYSQFCTKHQEDIDTLPEDDQMHFTVKLETIKKGLGL